MSQGVKLENVKVEVEPEPQYDYDYTNLFLESDVNEEMIVKVIEELEDADENHENPGYFPFESAPPDPTPVPQEIDEHDDQNFEQSEEWKAIENIVDKEVDIGKRKPAKRQKQEAYNKIIKALESRSKSVGFSDGQLLKIWKIICHSKCYLTCTQRKNMIYTMIPQKKVGDDVLHVILRSLGKAESSGIRPSVVVAMYQLLSLYADYFLVEYGSIVNASVVKQILTATTENFSLPWKLHLFKNLVHPDLIQKDDLLNMEKLLKSRKLKGTQRCDVELALGHCKQMIGSTDQIPDVKVRNLVFPEVVRTRFYGAFLRIYGSRSVESIQLFSHPMIENLFPEFIPAKRSVYEEVLALLDTDAGILELVNNPVLMSAFENWLDLIVSHKLNSFSGVSSTDDKKKWVKILDKCCVIIKLRNRGLPVLNRWLANFLRNWDLSLFQPLILQLIPYLTPQDVFPLRRQLEVSLTSKFASCYSDNTSLWESLTELFTKWASMWTMGNAPNKEIYMKALNWLLSLFDRIVTFLSVTWGNSTESEWHMLLYKICLFYKCFIQQVTRNPDQLVQLLCPLPQDLGTVVFLSLNKDCYDILKEIKAAWEMSETDDVMPNETVYLAIKPENDEQSSSMVVSESGSLETHEEKPWLSERFMQHESFMAMPD